MMATPPRETTAQSFIATNFTTQTQFTTQIHYTNGRFLLQLSLPQSSQLILALRLEAQHLPTQQVNNAGVMAIPARETTAEGFERQFGTDPPSCSKLRRSRPR